MKILGKENGLTPKQTFIGLGVIAALIFVALVWASQPDAKANATTLQQSVEMAQADYNLSQSQALAGLQQYCENWKGLATAKRQLADATGLNFNLTADQINSVDCKQVTVPHSF